MKQKDSLKAVVETKERKEREGESESQIARFNVRKPGPHAKGFPLGLIAFGFVCACLLEQIQHAQVSAFVFSTCKVRDHDK